MVGSTSLKKNKKQSSDFSSRNIFVWIIRRNETRDE